MIKGGPRKIKKQYLCIHLISFTFPVSTDLILVVEWSQERSTRVPHTHFSSIQVSSQYYCLCSLIEPCQTGNFSISIFFDQPSPHMNFYPFIHAIQTSSVSLKPTSHLSSYIVGGMIINKKKPKRYYGTFSWNLAFKSIIHLSGELSTWPEQTEIG